MQNPLPFCYIKHNDVISLQKQLSWWWSKGKNSQIWDKKSTRDEMYNKITVVSTAVHYIWMLLKEQIKSSRCNKKKFFLVLRGDGCKVIYYTVHLKHIQHYMLTVPVKLGEKMTSIYQETLRKARGSIGKVDFVMPCVSSLFWIITVTSFSQFRKKMNCTLTCFYF